MNITFIGLGIMGSRMAANLLQNGFKLRVFNRTKEAMNPVIASGAVGTDSIEEAVEQADVVFTMLSEPEVVKSIFLNQNGAVEKMKQGAIWVDCTTVDPNFSRSCYKVAMENGIHFVDAPVAGTKPQAENAELGFFVGASKELYIKLLPLINSMGKVAVHFEETGKGSAFKMLVNLQLAQSMTIFSETLLLGEKMGLDRDFLIHTLPKLPVTAPFTQYKKGMISQDDYEVNFPLEWMLKDLKLATAIAEDAKQPLHLANLTKSLFDAANKKGMGRLDFAAIHRYLKDER